MDAGLRGVLDDAPPPPLLACLMLGVVEKR